MKKLDDAFTSLYNGDNIIKLTELRYIPRWIVILIDILIIFTSIILSYLFLKQLQVKVNYPEYVLEKRLIVIVVNVIFMFIFCHFTIGFTLFFFLFIFNNK